MSSMISSVPGFMSDPAQMPAKVSHVEGSPVSQRPEQAAHPRALTPAQDEYVPEEKQEPSGRYWLGRDEDGRSKVFFDGPDRTEHEVPERGKASDAPGPAGKAGGNKAERCTGNTDAVDREIEKLKRKRETLEQRLAAEADEGKRKELEQKLEQVERELAQKDNDAYRRQHTVFS